MEDIIRLYDNYSGLKFSATVSKVLQKAIRDKIIIMLCFAGSAKISVGFKEYVMRKDSMLVIAPGIHLACSSHTEDFKVNILLVREDIFNKFSYGLIKIYFYRIMYTSPLLEIPERKTDLLKSMHRYLKDIVADEDNRFRNMIIVKFLDILLYEACNIVLHLPVENGERDRHRDEITGQFMKLVQQNFRTERKLEFYASEMNLTAKYLSAVVKSSTGHAATAWIDDYTVLEAKTLLRTSTKTIQQISYDLGFSTPSHFAKFIKDKTGVSPKEIRNSEPGSL